MRTQQLWRVAVMVVLLMVIVAVFTPARLQPLPPARRAAPSGPQSEDADADRAERGPLVQVEALRDPIVTLPVAFGTIESLKDVPAVPFKPSSVLARPEEPALPRSDQSGVSGPDAVVQSWAGSVSMPSPIANFDGISLADQGAAFSPPDTEGDIGYDPATNKRYYFQWINVAYKAWDVTNPASPIVVVPLTSGNALWQAALPGSQCASNNDGDPIVLFDEQAHRWFISQFSLGPSAGGPFHQCVAVSQTANPAGAWYVYDYPYRDGATYFNDYPHFGVWPDATYNAYLMTMHEFNAAGTSYLGQSASAFDRAKLLAGNSAAPLVTFALGTNYGGMLAADLDGAPPAAGTPGFFFMTDPAGTLQIWEFKPDWTTPANSVFGVGAGHAANYSLAISPYTDACTISTCDRVPQSGTSRLLDSLGDRLMHRVAFRVLSGGIQTAVLNHTVDPDGSAGSTRTGLRWYELRRNPAGGAWTVNQQSTYAPGTTDYRWMGSIATDQAGNIALGFSASSSSIFPSIRYAGRLFTDAPNTLPQAEVTMTVGLGAQTGSGRWGDYSMLSVDPQDGCTFWYTQEYNGSTGSLPWKTRIGSFKFAECVPTASGNLSGTVRNAANNNPINAATVTALSSNGASYPAATNAGGAYQIVGLPIGVYTVTASAAGFGASTVAGVNITTGVTTTQNFALTALPQADLSLIKTASAATVAPGGSLVYTLTVTNNGPTAITSTVTVTDALPAGYSLSNAAGSGWACSGTTTVVCTRSSLGVSASASVVINGTAPNTIGSIANTATVAANVSDLSPANNTATVTSTIAPSTDLAITKTGPASAAPGGTLVYTLGVVNNGPMTVGAFTTTFTNTANITINDNLPASPYPSTLVVPGLPPVQKATVQLLGFNHTYPRDVDVILVGPSGARSWLMSDPGGTSTVTGVNLTFDDAAASSISCSSGPTSGTYKPTDCTDTFGTDVFPTPAPAGPYTASLAQFNGTDPAGTWNLFMRDDTSGDSGSIGGGWALTLAGTYSLTVVDTLPPGVTFVDAGGSGWSCSQLGGVVTCTRSSLAPGAAPNIIITATAPLAAGVITNTAVIATNLNDSAPGNNTAQVATTIVAGPVHGVALTPVQSVVFGQPGTIVTHTFRLINTGTVGDTFTVVIGGSIFAVAAPPAVGPLAAGASVNFDVQVTIPLTATAGLSDDALLTATSQTDVVVSAQADVITAVPLGQVYLPVVLNQ